MLCKGTYAKVIFSKYMIKSNIKEVTLISKVRMCLNWMIWHGIWNIKNWNAGDGCSIRKTAIEVSTFPLFSPFLTSCCSLLQKNFMKDRRRRTRAGAAWKKEATKYKVSSRHSLKRKRFYVEWSNTHTYIITYIKLDFASSCLLFLKKTYGHIYSFLWCI